MDYNNLAELLYPNVDKNINKYFNKYPSRNLINGAVVTRFAPSPTGYLHIGGLFQCVTHQMLSKKPTSSFFLRLEDTDQKREIDNAGALSVTNFFIIYSPSFYKFILTLIHVRISNLLY